MRAIITSWGTGYPCPSSLQGVLLSASSCRHLFVYFVDVTVHASGHFDPDAVHVIRALSSQLADLSPRISVAPQPDDQMNQNQNQHPHQSKLNHLPLKDGSRPFANPSSSPPHRT